MGFEHGLIIPNEGFPFKLFQFEGKDGHYVREKHWHRSIEIFAVFEGTLAFFINEEEYPLGSGEFILLNSNEIHSISSPEANRTIVLQIPMNVLRNVETGEGLILFTHSPKRQDSKIMELIGSMYQELQERGSEYEWKVQSDFFMLVYLLLTKYRKREILPEEIRHYRKLNRLSTITDYIRENYTKELSLEMVADRFGYSPSYLSRMFRKYAQTNYKTYLQNVRIEYGFQELANTDHTIGEIALNNGFPNQKAFTREFKKKYGILPSEYRRGQKNAKD
ncbi:AraC family transcriptional regulator [Sellimonas intestinalis]|uniref:AraC family transcriptional regulator n=1 Tax=Sellimonas intestinalis TaxID=1653434 RepID=UPI0039F5BE26